MAEIRNTPTQADFTALQSYLEQLASGEEVQVLDTDSENADTVAMLIRDLAGTVPTMAMMKYGIQL